jgi:hypothetical protein
MGFVSGSIVRYAVPGFKLGEKLSGWPESSILFVFQALTDAFFGVNFVRIAFFVKEAVEAGATMVEWWFLSSAHFIEPIWIKFTMRALSSNFGEIIV